MLSGKICPHQSKKRKFVVFYNDQLLTPFWWNLFQENFSLRCSSRTSWQEELVFRLILWELFCKVPFRNSAWRHLAFCFNERQAAKWNISLRFSFVRSKIRKHFSDEKTPPTRFNVRNERDEMKCLLSRVIFFVGKEVMRETSENCKQLLREMFKGEMRKSYSKHENSSTKVRSLLVLFSNNLFRLGKTFPFLWVKNEVSNLDLAIYFFVYLTT